MLRTFTRGRGPFEFTVPRTVTLFPTCLAKPSVGKPSASRSATGDRLRSSTKTYLPSCWSTQPVIDPASAFALDGACRFSFCCWSAESAVAEKTVGTEHNAKKAVKLTINDFGYIGSFQHNRLHVQCHIIRGPENRNV